MQARIICTVESQNIHNSNGTHVLPFGRELELSDCDKEVAGLPYTASSDPLYKHRLHHNPTCLM